MIRFVAILFVLTVTSVAHAQGTSRFDASVHVASSGSSEFDATDVGVGGRFGWAALPLVGLEAEVTLYPTDYPDGRAFSGSRWEGLFGATVGPQLGRVRPFARVRYGFVSYAEAPEPFACIAIFPPPLACTLAGGDTVPAFDVGGGVAVTMTPRTFVRVDVGDRLLRYEGPVFRPGSSPAMARFWSHGFRLAAGAGLRF
jgi:hypothetical protein